MGSRRERENEERESQQETTRRLSSLDANQTRRNSLYSLPDELPMNFGSPLCTEANPTPFNKLSISLSLLLGSPECIDGEEVMLE